VPVPVFFPIAVPFPVPIPIPAPTMQATGGPPTTTQQAVGQHSTAQRSLLGTRSSTQPSEQIHSFTLQSIRSARWVYGHLNGDERKVRDNVY
jgi:hypothetical protein